MTEARAKSDGRVDLKALIEAAASFDSASPSEEIGAFTGDGSWRSLGTVADIRRLASTVAAMAEELMALREAVKDARTEVWHLGLVVGQIAKWPRRYFNRFYVEEWAIRTATILTQWGDKAAASEVLAVTSGNTKPNKRLEEALSSLNAAQVPHV